MEAQESNLELSIVFILDSAFNVSGIGVLLRNGFAVTNIKCVDCDTMPWIKFPHHNEIYNATCVHEFKRIAEIEVSSFISKSHNKTYVVKYFTCFARLLTAYQARPTVWRSFASNRSPHQ